MYTLVPQDKTLNDQQFSQTGLKLTILLLTAIQKQP